MPTHSFIAAAPEMKDALEAIKKADSEAEVEAAFILVNSALAKARGESER